MLQRALCTLLAASGLCLALPASTLGQEPHFVYEVRDGRLKNGARYDIRLEEVRRTPDSLTLRVIQRTGPRPVRRMVSFQAVCAYMSREGKTFAEMPPPGPDRELLHVRFPAQPSQAELDDESRRFFTRNLCQKLASATP